MENKIISEGKTTNEAIENGLKMLKVSKNMVDIKVLENEDKRSFFSILSPRIVKVELTLKEDKVREVKEQNEIKEKPRREIILSEEEQEQAKANIETFLREFIAKLSEKVDYDIVINNSVITVNLKSEELGYLIGYRGETLYAFQMIISTIAGKNIDNRVRVSLDIGGYKKKREKTLEELADKIAKTVIKTRKPVTLEPMQAYERKIIHAKLQENEKIETKSIGEEPRRRIVISLRNEK